MVVSEDSEYSEWSAHSVSSEYSDSSDSYENSHDITYHDSIGTNFTCIGVVLRVIIYARISLIPLTSC